MKKLIILLIFLSIPLSADTINPTCYSYDYDFNIKEFLFKIHSPLAGIFIRERPVSEIIKYYCLRYNINQRFILDRLEFEQSLLSGSVSGRLFIYPDGGKKPLRWVLDRSCGYGQLPNNQKFSKHYLGFEHQIANCAMSLKSKLKKKENLKDIIFEYTPIQGSWETFIDIWRMFWPKDILEERD